MNFLLNIIIGFDSALWVYHAVHPSPYLFPTSDMQSSLVLLRKRTPWRELLHPLPSGHRKMLWLKRDKVEANEEILRRPYYTLKTTEDHSPMRSTLVLPTVIGPGVGVASPHQFGAPLPRYPTGWETVAPQSPSQE